MLRSICLVCWRNQALVTLQKMRSRQIGLLYSSYQSHYSLNRLYPGSDPDIIKPLERPTDSIYQRLNQTVADSEKLPDVEPFSGHIPMDKLELNYTKSSGPGGQHVNKVETKVEMRFHVATAEWLPISIRDQLLEKKKTKINAKGELLIKSQKTRSQIKNVQDCLLKLREMIDEVQRKPKEPDEKSAAVWRMRQEKSTRERLRQKAIHANKKQSRRVYADD